MSNFFFCHNVFKKLSAAEASESVYMRERVNAESILIERCPSQLIVDMPSSSINQLMHDDTF